MTRPILDRDPFWLLCFGFFALAAAVPLASFPAASVLVWPLIATCAILHVVSLHVIPAGAKSPVDGFARSLGLSFFAVIGGFSVTLFAIMNAAANETEPRGCGMIALVAIFVPAASWVAHVTYGILVAAGLAMYERLT